MPFFPEGSGSPTVPYTSVLLVPATRLIGNSTEDTASAEAITVGTGLTLADGTLSNTHSGEHPKSILNQAW